MIQLRLGHYSIRQLEELLCALNYALYHVRIDCPDFECENCKRYRVCHDLQNAIDYNTDVLQKLRNK